MNREEHLSKNYKAFQKMLPELMITSEGRWAVFKDEKLVAMEDTVTEAINFAMKKYGDEVFSLQEIRDTPIQILHYSKTERKRAGEPSGVSST